MRLFAGILSVRAQAGNNNSGSSSGSSSDAGGSAATLAAHRSWLQRQRVLHSEPHPSDGDIIELNVGGAVMVASRSTLRQVRIRLTWNRLLLVQNMHYCDVWGWRSAACAREAAYFASRHLLYIAGGGCSTSH
jgi:hypothetical protein